MTAAYFSSLEAVERDSQITHPRPRCQNACLPLIAQRRAAGRFLLSPHTDPRGRLRAKNHHLQSSQVRPAELRDVGRLQRGSAHELSFPDSHFNVVHCHAVLVHLPDAASAVKEMRRVCKPGGYVAAREPDRASLVMHPSPAGLEQWKAAQMHLKRHESAEPHAGRHLAQWAVEAGFDRGTVEVSSNVLQYSGDGLPAWTRRWATRLDDVLGERAVSDGVAPHQDIPQVFERLAREEAGLWALMHTRLLARK